MILSLCSDGKLGWSFNRCCNSGPCISSLNSTWNAGWISFAALVIFDVREITLPSVFWNRKSNPSSSSGTLISWNKLGFFFFDHCPFCTTTGLESRWRFLSLGFDVGAIDIFSIGSSSTLPPEEMTEVQLNRYSLILNFFFRIEIYFITFTKLWVQNHLS